MTIFNVFLEIFIQFFIVPLNLYVQVTWVEQWIIKSDKKKIRSCSQKKIFVWTKLTTKQAKQGQGLIFFKYISQSSSRILRKWEYIQRKVTTIFYQKSEIK